MLNFTDTRSFGASCVGLTAFGTSYIAGMDGWLLAVLPMLGFFGYDAVFD
jgi:hypothetical protein